MDSRTNQRMGGFSSCKIINYSWHEDILLGFVQSS